MKLNPMVRLAEAFDAFLNRLAPLDVHARSYLAMRDLAGSDRLADAEADAEVWEPGEQLEPWEKELREIFNSPEYRAETGHLETASAGDSITKDVATITAVVLRGQGINSAPIYADLIARELGHHFDITRK